MAALSSLNLTLAIDIATAGSAPNFFAMLGLVLRASGAEILVFGPNDKTGPLAASYSIAFTEVLFPSRMSPHAPARVFQSWKRDVVMKKLGTAGHRVIWVDDAFSDWRADSIDGVPQLVALNWAKVALQMNPKRAKA